MKAWRGALAGRFPLFGILALMFTWNFSAAAQAQDYHWGANYIDSNQTVTIYGYLGPGGPVIIPATIAGLPVTRIEHFAFSLTKITSVTIPENVTSLGDGVFYLCTSLGQVSIPNSLTNIGSRAFFGCHALTNLTIPGRVARIGLGAFEWCTALNTIGVEAENPFYSSADGVLFDKSQAVLIKYPEGRPAGDYAIPSATTRIESRAFFSSMSLTNIMVPATVATIGDGAFAACLVLDSIAVDPANPAYRSLEGVLYDKHQAAILQCPGGRTGTYLIPGGVTRIGNEAFSWCWGLTNINIPDSVTNLGHYAFYNCRGLAGMTLSDNILGLGVGVFQACAALSDIALPGNLADIPAGAFAGCAGLTNVVMPGTLTSIGPDAFVNCPSLTNIAIPQSVSTIGESAFANCISLTQVNIPNSVTSIADGVFESCTNLAEMVIPEGVTRIGVRAFGNCSRLSRISIPNSVTNIGNSALAFCSRLASVTISGGVVSVGNYAFMQCSNLTGLYCEGNAPDFGDDVFNGAEQATVYYVPDTTGWSSDWGGRPTALWQPQVQTNGPLFGVRSNQFGFNLAWASERTLVVEACTNLADPVWLPISTNLLLNGGAYFCDPAWTNQGARFYRLRSP